ncbi:MAG: enoyl-CoA hydratase [Gammaproteobacteria bacterium]|jgi:enoyl-CoA hydratase/carnithine racemase|nr:enoyl-CoA hydratase [Gammaproteobacteria bacterium]MBT5203008.1 enoyl-CoA hydratase [Gammaproteobacteria bacterium]MBT5603859.1 enoyl-CoA hydratase [Gammaproteobacteria bacterium]MBT6244294.1 enoyl-CoA hydratase [Gammaproteobacteria bacterium]
MYEHIKYEVSDPVAIITLNRPDALNAITGRMQAELKHALATAEKDEAVVGIVLTGAGRGFCAGADIGGLQATASGEAGGQAREDLSQFSAKPGNPDMGEDFTVTFSYIPSLQKPLIAAINGACAGLGFVFACLCDMRFVEKQAKFTSAFVNRGLIAEHGSSWILPRIIGLSNALDLLWSGRKFDGIEADKLGLANRLCDEGTAKQQAIDYIKELAATAAPNSIKIIKAQLYRHLNMTFGPAMQESNQLMAESLNGGDFKEGVSSFVERRPPEFKRVGD